MIWEKNIVTRIPITINRMALTARIPGNEKIRENTLDYQDYFFFRIAVIGEFVFRKQKFAAMSYFYISSRRSRRNLRFGMIWCLLVSICDTLWASFEKTIVLYKVTHHCRWLDAFRRRIDFYLFLILYSTRRVCRIRNRDTHTKFTATHTHTRHTRDTNRNR
jgi:hypothetical protein